MSTTPAPAPAPDAQTAKVDAVDVLRQVLLLQQEGDPSLDVDDCLKQAIAFPDREIVDSIGSVSVICLLFEGYDIDNLIPQHLLNHRNLSTLDGLRRVIGELEKRRCG